MKKFQFCFLPLLFCCFTFSTLKSQPQENKLDGLADYGATFPIQLESDPENENVKVGYFEGTLDKGQIRLTYKGLKALQPVAISLIPKNPEDKLDFKILKAHWEDVVRVKENVSEYAQFVFRTKGDFGVEITSEALSAAFYIMVWVGKEVTLRQHKLFFPAKQFIAKNRESAITPKANEPVTMDVEAVQTIKETASGTSWTTILITISLIGIFIMLLLFFLRTSKRKTIQVWLFMLISTSIFAQNSPQLHGSPRYGDDWFRAPVNPEFDNRFINTTPGAIPTPWQNGSQNREVFMTLSNMIDKFNTMYNNGMALQNALEGLIAEDDSYIPDYDPRGMPQLPSSCMESVYKAPNPRNTRTVQNSGNSTDAESSSNCECLEAAYENFYEAQWIFEYMRTEYASVTNKTNNAIAFGDGVSSIHGASALAWQTQKIKIVKALKNFEKSYDKGYDNWIDKLYHILMEIDTCENKAGFEDWYRRAGFIYYEFMKLKYKRN